jgi:hypothetical protein
MSTVFVLRGIDSKDVEIKSTQTENHNTVITTAKNKFDVINPGKISHISPAGAIVRVLQRGDVYDKQGNIYEREATKQCWFHRMTFDGLAMGIPIRISQGKVYCDGTFCSYSCVYAFLLDHMEKMPCKRDPNYINSIVLLKQLFEDEFPGEELTATLDWKLSKDVGNGNLTFKEFMFGLKGIRVIARANYIYTPVTVTYDIVKEKD